MSGCLKRSKNGSNRCWWWSRARIRLHFLNFGKFYFFVFDFRFELRIQPRIHVHGKSKWSSWSSSCYELVCIRALHHSLEFLIWSQFQNFKISKKKVSNFYNFSEVLINLHSIRHNVIIQDPVAIQFLLRIQSIDFILRIEVASTENPSLTTFKVVFICSSLSKN